MAKKYVFVGNVIHDGQHFNKGQLCPENVFESMHAQGLVAPLPEPVAAPAQPQHEDPAKKLAEQLAKEKAEQEAEAKAKAGKK